MAIYYNVRPKYSAGSPASVSAEIAAMVANDEREAHAATLRGIYGEASRAVAEKDTLRGLSERVIERRDAWLVEDLITEERYVRPFPSRAVESPLMQGRRFARLRHNYALPLETDLPKEKV